eukprot:m.565571 g.565571  ORF g.565571 m.565571 type:complete len:795 (-) comp22245_c0_seq4:2423-4807(-)
MADQSSSEPLPADAGTVTPDAVSGTTTQAEPTATKEKPSQSPDKSTDKAASASQKVKDTESPEKISKSPKKDTRSNAAGGADGKAHVQKVSKAAADKKSAGNSKDKKSGVVNKSVAPESAKVQPSSTSPSKDKKSGTAKTTGASKDGKRGSVSSNATSSKEKKAAGGSANKGAVTEVKGAAGPSIPASSSGKKKNSGDASGPSNASQDSVSASGGGDRATDNAVGSESSGASTGKEGKGGWRSMFRSKRGQSKRQGSSASIDAPGLPGRIDGCPLENAVYDAAWERFKLKGWPRRVSRLYNNLDDVLRDQHALRYFIAYLKSRNSRALLQFWNATEKFAKGLYKKSTSDGQALSAPEAAMDIYTRFLLRNRGDETSDTGSGTALNSGVLPSDIEQRLHDALGVAATEGESDTKEGGAAVGEEDQEDSDASLKNAKSAPTGAVTNRIFRDAQRHVYNLLKTDFFVKFMQSPLYSQYCLSVLTADTVRLEDMLYNESFQMGFMDFMAKAEASTIIQFWLIAGHFQEQHGKVTTTASVGNTPCVSVAPSPAASDDATDGAEAAAVGDAVTEAAAAAAAAAEMARGDAVGIYNRYLSLDAAEPLGIDSEIRKETELLVCRAEGGPDPDSFLRALSAVYTAMDKFYFPEYLQSDTFRQYTSRLTSAANATGGDKGAGGADGASNHTAAGGRPEGDGTDDEDDGATDKRSLLRTHSLGSIDAWGVYVRDEQATNPLFNDRRRKGRMTGLMKASIGIKQKSDKDRQEEQEQALEAAREIIQAVYKEMNEHNSIDGSLLKGW